ncbi:MAG: spore coat U domain-containing protein [Polaromonas sp.]|nr:spore coat U domain-containing protein [Polaromonas sp.]
MRKNVTFGNIKNLFKTGLVAAAVLGACAGAHAATNTTTFLVKLVITESCTISTPAPTDVDFGSQVRATAAVNVNVTGTLNVNCSAGTSYTVGLNGGINTTGTIGAPTAGQRRMKLSTGATLVPYELYQVSGGTTFWGNTPGTNTVAGTGTGSSTPLSVYGKLTSTNFPAGSYEDTVTATITY